MLSPSFFDHLEDRLNLAVYDINQEYQMSITGFEPGAIQAKLDAAIEKIAAQIEKEADDALQEFAVHTNGGPALATEADVAKPKYPTYP